MVAKVMITCAECGAQKEIEFGEWNYWHRRGREHFFCSRSCTAKFRNRPYKIDRTREIICQHCGKSFVTSSEQDVKYCSRSCASAASVTPARRAGSRKGGVAAQKLPTTVHFDILSAQKALKRREMWKYEELIKLLDKQGVRYEFEYLLDHYIFDLALLDRRILIEFDGSYHVSKEQLRSDQIKATYAAGKQWIVFHVPTEDNVIIPSDVILPYIR